MKSMFLECFIMRVVLFLIAFMSLATGCLAIQEKIKEEFGSCYESFQKNIESCTPFSCSYPDLSTTKAWRANVIRGMVNDKCYVISYSYLGSNIIGEPEHCFYSNEDKESISLAYSILFSTDLVIKMAEAKDEINALNSRVCRRN